MCCCYKKYPHQAPASSVYDSDVSVFDPTMPCYGLPSLWVTAVSIRELHFTRLQSRTWDYWMAVKHFAVFIVLRVEPALTRIKEDRKRIILPAIDNIKYNTFEVQQYANAAHGYNWGLWCMYIIPPQDWLDKGDESAPIR